MQPQSAPQLASSKWGSLCAGFALVLLGTAAFSAVVPLRPQEGFVGDFTQDWLSARDFHEGRPAYGDLPGALRRHFGGEPPKDFLRWNAHPPASVLLVLPLAGLSHVEAFAVWNAVTFALFVVAVWIVASEFGIRPAWRAAALAAVVSALGSISYPLRQQVILGQFNCLLAFLITVAWAADRRGCWWLAGSAVGAAMAVKLFPGFLLLYFFATRNWRALAVAVAVFLAVNGAAVALFGADTFRTYIRDVIPAVSADYATRWNNLSAPAFWLRLFDPAPSSGVIPVVHSPLHGKLFAHAAQVLITGCVAWLAWRASRANSNAARDRAFAAAVVAMLLISPITWPHSLVMLVVPVAVLIAAKPSGANRWVLVACLMLMWLPDTFAPRLAFGADEAERLSNHHHTPLSPVANLLVASIPHYALLGLFVLTLRLAREAKPNEPEA